MQNFVPMNQKFLPKEKTILNLKSGFIALRKTRRILDLLNLCDRESCLRERLKKAKKRFVSMFVARGGEEEEGEGDQEWARYKYIKAI